MSLIEYSEIIRNVVFALAAASGGGWAIWKWWHEQCEKHRLEVFSVEGELRAHLVPLTEKRAVLTVETLWNNLSIRNIHIDPKQSYVRIYEVPLNKNVQALNITEQLGRPVVQAFPYKDRKWYMLEAKSLNRLTAHFVVNRNSVYAIRWKLYRDQRKHKTSYAWTKELILSTHLSEV